MPREGALKLEVADGIREVRLGTYRKTGDRAEAEWFDRNRLGTEPYARWCGRTAEATPPPTRFNIVTGAGFVTPDDICMSPMLQIF